jgi:translocation and assembly module TamB
LIKEIYLPLRTLLIFALVLIFGFAFIVSHKNFVPFLAEKYLKDFGVEYSSIEGTLLSGVVIYDFKYEDKISAKRVEVEYKILNLLRPMPKFSSFKSLSLHIESDKFTASDENGSDFFIPAFEVETLSAAKTKIMVQNEVIFLDAEVSELAFDESLNAQNVHLKLGSIYANATLKGSIDENKLSGDGIFELDTSISKKYLAFIKDVPKKQKLKLEATVEKLRIFTRFDTLQLSSEEDFTFKNAEVDFKYVLGANDFNIDVKHDFFYKEYAAQNRAKVWVNTDGKYTAELKVNNIKEPFGLGFNDVEAMVSGDAEGIEVKLKNTTIDALVKSSDYENYDVTGSAKDFKLSFLTNLPQELQNESITFRTNARVQTSPLHISGDVNANSVYGSFETAFMYEKNKVLYDVQIFPNAEHEIYRGYNLENFLPFKMTYKNGMKTHKIEINANTLQANFLKKDASIQGSGTLAGTKFHLIGNLDASEINIESKIPSLKKLIANIFKDSFDANDVYDAHVDLHANVKFDEKLRIKTELKIPLYVVEVDTQTSHIVENIALETSYEDEKLVIENYFFQYKKHDFYSKKASTINFDKDFNMMLEELWLYDTILIKGFVNKETLEGNVTLTSEKFEYIGADANVRAKIDLVATFSPKLQKVEGKIALLDGVISYKPVTDYAIEDSDIIIIQDIKQGKESHLLINIQVDSIKPIAYKIKDVNLMVTPDITLFQEAGSAFQVLGVLTINEGDATFSGKKFEFDKSEIYFNGHKPINPQLNLNIHHHTIDYIDIEIYVTNTLEDPVIIFSSKPALSQNDIMSYILFGESASSMFDPTSDASKSSLLLASGLKQLVNETSPIHVDTLNVLTNKEGTLGYEIGSRFNEKIRIVYKNDTASSIILQYSLSKSVRIEVDVRETGQGVSIIYVKDF